MLCTQRPGFPGVAIFFSISNCGQHFQKRTSPISCYHKACRLKSCRCSVLEDLAVNSWTEIFKGMFRVSLSLSLHHLSFLELLNVFCRKPEKQHVDVGSGMFCVSCKYDCNPVVLAL